MAKDAYRAMYRVEDNGSFSPIAGRDQSKREAKPKDAKGLKYQMERMVIEHIEKIIAQWEDERGSQIAQVLKSVDDGEWDTLEGGILKAVEEELTKLRFEFDWTERFEKLEGQ